VTSRYRLCDTLGLPVHGYETDAAAFGSVMSKLPMISMMVLPFEPLWSIARAGVLRAGDPAPDFRLQTYDKSSRTTLQLPR